MHQPRVSTPFPGPKAREILALDRKFMSQSMTRLYPIVAERGCGCWISDVDGNLFLAFTARRFLPSARRPACAEARGAWPNEVNSLFLKCSPSLRASNDVEELTEP